MKFVPLDPHSRLRGQSAPAFYLLLAACLGFGCSDSGNKPSDSSAGGGNSMEPTTEIPADAIIADSCEQADVQSAVDGASAGKTVVVPEGTCTWGVDGTGLTLSTALTLRGKGQGKTVIDIAPTAGSWTTGVIRLNAPSTVQSLTIRTPTAAGSGTAFTASVDGFRITDIEFLGRTNSVNGYFLYADTYGLVDSCSITGGSGENELIFARGPENSWQTPSSMGTDAALVVEDCVFQGEGYVSDCNSNARCTFRFNTIQGPMKIDGHGKASNTPPRGVRQMEVYSNEWTNTDSYHTDIELRGGTGRVFGNGAAASGQWLILHEYAATTALPNFGDVVQTEYPVDDQIGVGADPKVGGSEPLYLWNNRAGGEPWPVSLGYGDEAVLENFIQSDRDYFIETSAFDGTSGVGSGTAAEMRAVAPARKGVGFWVTDEGSWNQKDAATDGTLYVWDGAAWQRDYIPLSYPHPRRSL